MLQNCQKGAFQLLFRNKTYSFLFFCCWWYEMEYNFRTKLKLKNSFNLHLSWKGIVFFQYLIFIEQEIPFLPIINKDICIANQSFFLFNFNIDIKKCHFFFSKALILHVLLSATWYLLADNLLCYSVC